MVVGTRFQLSPALNYKASQPTPPSLLTPTVYCIIDIISSIIVKIKQCLPDKHCVCRAYRYVFCFPIVNKFPSFASFSRSPACLLISFISVCLFFLFFSSDVLSLHILLMHYFTIHPSLIFSSYLYQLSFFFSHMYTYTIVCLHLTCIFLYQ